ncbi:MAG: hypothetical protein ILP10_07050 [Lachnospiraceae bacterium]|nr:hypothetical protein [Lachnospiraceae bacterium]
MKAATAIKNGIKSMIRTPGKTLVFALIFTVTSALLSVSFCVYTAVSGYLDEADGYFHTIAELEYEKRDYSDQTAFDKEFAAVTEEIRGELGSLIASDSVIRWEPASSEVAYTPLIHRLDSFVPDPDAAVLRLTLRAYDKAHDLYNATVAETLYSRKDYTDKLVMFRTAQGGYTLECPGSYIVAGHYFAAGLQFTSFHQETVLYHDGDELVELPPELTGKDDEATEALFRRYAEKLRIKNDAYRAVCTSDIEDTYPFHQQLLMLTKGRYFTDEEYRSRAHVCIVSERIAGRLELDIGDSLPFTVFTSSEDVYDDKMQTQIDEGDYEIIGITNHSDAFPLYVFLPDDSVKGKIHPVNGYTLGTFLLKNDKVKEFKGEASSLLSRGFRLNIYDQGYSAATGPMEELLLICVIFLAVCLLLAICALALQSYLFVSKQKETAKTMHAMGSGRPHVCVYFLSAAILLTLFGIVLGSIVCRLVEGKVFEILKEFIQRNSSDDLRFSATKIAVTKTLEFNPLSSPSAYVWASAVLLCGTLISTLLIAARSLHVKKPSKKKITKFSLPGHEAGTSKLSGFFKYSLLSMMRGRVRTAAILVLAVAASLFYCNLSSSMENYRTQLESFKDNTVICGNATDYSGKMIGNLILDGGTISMLAASDLLESSDYTTGLGHIKYLGVEGKEQIPYTIPETGSYAYESAFYWMQREPVWTGTSSILGSPLFQNYEGGTVEWLEGYGDKDFISLSDFETVIFDTLTGRLKPATVLGGPPICALPESMMKEYDILLGDEINCVVAINHPMWGDMLYTDRLKVVASYKGPVSSNMIFSPVTTVYLDTDPFPPVEDSGNESYWVSRKYYTGKMLTDFYRLGLTPELNYSSMSFELKDARRLDELRSFMEDTGFTWVRSGERHKTFAKIDDETYLSTVRSMERQIRYVEVLYSALYLLAGVIGAVLAWLIIQSRRREIGLMRALGTPHVRIACNFLAEQFVLMALGLGVGALIVSLTGIGLNIAGLVLISAFLGVWTLSSLACLIAGLLKPSYASLNDPE